MASNGNADMNFGKNNVFKVENIRLLMNEQMAVWKKVYISSMNSTAVEFQQEKEKKKKEIRQDIASWSYTQQFTTINAPRTTKLKGSHTKLHKILNALYWCY